VCENAGESEITLPLFSFTAGLTTFGLVIVLFLVVYFMAVPCFYGPL
jgi:hypothetical protein